MFAIDTVYINGSIILNQNTWSAAQNTTVGYISLSQIYTFKFLKIFATVLHKSNVNNLFRFLSKAYKCL